MSKNEFGASVAARNGFCGRVGNNHTHCGITRVKLAVACLLTALSGSLRAAEYFVAVDGSDANDGLSPATAFHTIQRGVAALEPGDTLTIGPGEYLENVTREELGGPGADTVIRAAVPGTVLLRGDVPAPEFETVEGYRFVYAAQFTGHVPQAVNEVDTMRILESVPSLDELEFNPGAFHYDAEAGILYMSTSDLAPPASHLYTVSVLDGRGGIFLVRPERVIIEGLAATGFHSAAALPRLGGGNSSADRTPHGFYLWRARRSVVRDCRAYLNAAGISILSSGGNMIERCVGYANGSQHGGSSGNIVVFSLEDDIIRECITYNGWRHGTRMYGGGENPAGIMADNLSWGNRGAEFQIKAGALAAEHSRVERCLAPLKGIIATDIRNCVIGERLEPVPGSIVLGLEEDLDPGREFADPDNFDYRLQSTSRFRGAGADGADLGAFPYEPNIYYVRPDGDDAADGLSITTAWQTPARALAGVAAGDTLYFEAGNYAAGAALELALEAGAPVRIRSRGHGSAVLEDALTVQGGTVAFERLTFAGGVILRDGHDARFENCRFTGGDTALQAESVAGLRLTHCEFTGFTRTAVDAAACSDIFMQGNIFDGARAALRLDRTQAVLYGDYNSYSRQDAVWEVDGAGYSLAALRERGLERYALVLEPQYRHETSGTVLLNADMFAGRGPFGKSLGVHVATPREISSLRLAGPFLHSATDTTLNIEWWVSGPTDFELAWGRDDQLTQHALIEGHRFVTFSLDDLKPDTAYTLRVKLDHPLVLSGAAAGVRQMADDTVEITLRTAAESAPTAIYYVAPDGDNARDGRSRDRAWRTVGHAAGRVRAGDTVMIAGGTYHESVRLRATGEWGRPITLRAMPGEKVVFDGDGRTLDFAFLLTDKSFVNIDGMYFVDFRSDSPAMPWSDRAGGRSGSIVVYRGAHVRITRCFHDSRGPGYGPGMLMAWHTSDLLLRNCVIMGSMGGGVSFAGCPRLRIEHNVFLRNLIQNVSEALNEPDQKFLMANNIFTDSIAGKVGGALFAIGKLESLVERDNCYYLRIPNEERMMFMFYEPEPAYERAARSYRLRYEFDEPPVITERTRLSLAGYQSQFNPGSGSVAIDPMLQASLAMDRVDDDGQPVYLGDRLSGLSDLDFHHLYTTHPDLIKRGIGLQPEAFADFHFNVQPGD